MLEITFKYRDKYSNWQWREQQCIMSSVSECIKIYGLGIDCDYEIVSVKEIKQAGRIRGGTRGENHLFFVAARIVLLQRKNLRSTNFAGVYIRASV